MTQVITFGNFKGGVGKTSNSTMVALELSNRDFKTLLVDLDPQGNATNLYLKTKLNISNEVGHFDKTLMSSVEDGNLDSSIINIKDNLDLLASAPDFSLYPRYMEKLHNYNDRVKEFDRLLTPLKAKYDYVIIDIPPTISLITDSALYASDYCLIVMQTHEHSFEGAEAFIKYIQEEVIDEYQAPRLELVGILAVLLQAGAPVDEATVANAISKFGEENLFKTRIHSMQRLKRYGITGITFKSKFDKRVFAVYKDVTDELLQRIEVIEHG
ncbi:ParA family protein [Lactiplantibacillus plantarum]|uniref:ParA family protein n=1 Tax=Lactiplantibacillus plantarum TaxID=1590 RepID=UPI0023DE9ECA|nr:AAA family ATPase [Lactiplantibacillus plantarum]MDF3266334.1 AAA family ATPase [Lactiplantibacillus plantarum]MDO1604332.1 AAA family ATPase [Lactiplantibacillus plantarum]